MITAKQWKRTGLPPEGLGSFNRAVETYPSGISVIVIRNKVMMSVNTGAFTLRSELGNFKTYDDAEVARAELDWILTKHLKVDGFPRGED